MVGAHKPTEKEKLMNAHRVTLPDGTVATRNSKARTYTHAVVVHGPLWRDGSVVEGWAAVSWAGSEALANKAAATFRGYGCYDTVRIAPVE